MKVVLAPDCGFCFGVRRAIEMAEATAGEGGPVYSWGPLIHNPQVIARLKEAGIRIAQRLEDIPAGTVVIRSHGVHPDRLAEIKQRGLRVVDATCPFVRRAQEKARVLGEEGYTVVVVGDREHPEVQAIVGHAKKAVVTNLDSKEVLDVGGRIGIIAQTTQSPEDFQEVVVGILAAPFEEVRVFNTICQATVRRQQSALEVARQVEVMLVVGGFESANTRRLAKLCSRVVSTHHVETAEQVEVSWLKGVETVGVTAGASTPPWIVKDVVKRLKNW